MIQCPECGREISGKAKKCVHCGKVLIEDVVPTQFCGECGKEIPAEAKDCPFCGCPIEKEDIQNSAVVEKIAKKVNKKIITAVIAVAVVVAIGLLISNFFRGSLNEDEQLAYQNAVEMKNMMRDPDSFKLYDQMALLKHRDDEGNVDYVYTIFKYGGTNGYGAITTDQAVFKDGEYIMNYGDDPDKEASNYEDQLLVDLDLMFYQLLGDTEEWEWVDIDVGKIKDKMGLKE